MNINSAIMEGAKILKNNFISSAYLDSEILMAKAINKKRDYIILNSKKILCKNDLNNFKKLIKARSYREPIAYLTNKKFESEGYTFFTNGKFSKFFSSLFL